MLFSQPYEYKSRYSRFRGNHFKTAAKYSLVKGFRPSVEVSESLPFLAVECSFPLKRFIKSKVTPGHMDTEL